MLRVQWRYCGNFDTLGAAGCDGDGGFFRRARARQERAAREGRMAEKNCREHALQSAPLRGRVVAQGGCVSGERGLSPLRKLSPARARSVLLKMPGKLIRNLLEKRPVEGVYPRLL